MFSGAFYGGVMNAERFVKNPYLNDIYPTEEAIRALSALRELYDRLSGRGSGKKGML